MKPHKRKTSASMNIISRSLLGLLLLPLTAQYALAQCARSATVTVRESSRLVDTGINVAGGETINFSASGRISAGDLWTGENEPDGVADLRLAGTEYPLPGARSYSLLGQIENNPPFYVGQGTQLTARSSGRLFLRINDNVAGNGSGQFTCTVSVSRPVSTITADRTFSVPESTRGVPTGITINDGDRIIFQASSRIWAGDRFIGANGPEGVEHLANHPNYPLVGARRFSLLGRVGSGRPFYIGQFNEVRHSGASGQLSLLINDDAPGGGNGQFISRVRVHRDGAPLNSSFAGTATLTISNPNTPTPFVEPLRMLPVVFSQDRCTVSLVSFPSIVRTFPVPLGSNTATITRLNGGVGTFDRSSGTMTVPITLRIANSHPLGGTSDLSLTLSTAAPGGRSLGGGSFTLAGSGRFTGGFLNGSNATLVVSGTVSPAP